jgi:hypothetical protein
MAAIQPPETDRIPLLLRRRPPAATLGWAALVATDPGAAVCDVPALLLTRLPGVDAIPPLPPGILTPTRRRSAATART